MSLSRLVYVSCVCEQMLKKTTQKFKPGQQSLKGGNAQESLTMPIRDWPVSTPEATDALLALQKSHVAKRMNAYDVEGNFIEPNDYEERLRGAAVIMRFTMEKYVMRVGPAGNKQTRDCFVANVASIRVVVPPKQVTHQDDQQTLHRSDPFTPDFSVKGKRRKISVTEDSVCG
jgi:hypothetical protein